MDGVGDRGGRADADHFAQALRAQSVEGRVFLVDEFHLAAAHVGVHGDLVFGDVVVEEAAEAGIDFAAFGQRRADAPDDAG